MISPTASLGAKQIVLGAMAKHGITPGAANRAIQSPDFTVSVLHAIGAPVTPNTTAALQEWQRAEGGPHDNPMNTTLGQAGAQGSAIKGYGSTNAGIDATVKTLQNGLYRNVIKAFQNNQSPAQIRQAIINSPWDVNHYSGTDFARGLISAKGYSAPPAKGVQPQQLQQSNLLSFPALPGIPNIQAIKLPNDQAATQTRLEALTSMLRANPGKALTTSQLLRAASLPTSAQAMPTVNIPNLPNPPAPPNIGSSTTTTPPATSKDPFGGPLVKPNFYGHPENVSSSVRTLIALMETKFPGLQVTSTLSGSHAQDSYHYRGEAVDMAGPPAVMNQAAQWIMSSGLYRSLVEAIHNGGGGLSVKNGKIVPSSFWGAPTWAEHANHIHLALTGTIGGLHVHPQTGAVIPYRTQK
jgi:hypothetical protein